MTECNVASVVETGAMSKRKPATGESRPPQINFRPDEELHADLLETCDGLKVNMPNLVCMILAENVYPYLERARRAKQRREKGEEN